MRYSYTVDKNNLIEEINATKKNIDEEINRYEQINPFNSIRANMPEINTLAEADALLLKYQNLNQKKGDKPPPDGPPDVQGGISNSPFNREKLRRQALLDQEELGSKILDLIKKPPEEPFPGEPLPDNPFGSRIRPSMNNPAMAPLLDQEELESILDPLIERPPDEPFPGEPFPNNPFGPRINPFKTNSAINPLFDELDGASIENYDSGIPIPNPFPNPIPNPKSNKNLNKPFSLFNTNDITNDITNDESPEEPFFPSNPPGRQGRSKNPNNPNLKRRNKSEIFVQQPQQESAPAAPRAMPRPREQSPSFNSPERRAPFEQFQESDLRRIPEYPGKALPRIEVPPYPPVYITRARSTSPLLNKRWQRSSNQQALYLHSLEKPKYLDEEKINDIIDSMKNTFGFLNDARRLKTYVSARLNNLEQMHKEIETDFETHKNYELLKADEYIYSLLDQQSDKN